MYVTSVTIDSIKGLDHVEWSVPLENAAGWHTVLGVNASGKSTFIKCIAAALIGSRECYALKQNWSTWVKQGKDCGTTSVRVDYSTNWDHVGKQEGTYSLCELQFKDASVLDQVVRLPVGDRVAPEWGIWGNYPGFFSAGFGPFRRFTGGGLEFESQLVSTPKLVGHISAFDEKAALSSALEWLRNQKFIALEITTTGGEDYSIVDDIKAFVNQDGFLPGGVKLDLISSSGVDFIDGNGAKVSVLEMSDGFRSILSLSFELIRLLDRTFNLPSQDPAEARSKLFVRQSDGSIVVNAPGVVLIDEVDAHLHPTWQRTIGPWFTKHFPNMQFIVTTHSPFVCQASSNGTIYVLDSTLEGVQGRFLEGSERDRILYGDILDAYGTQVFGSGMTRSDESTAKLQRLAQLNTKSLFNQLSKSEATERDVLRSVMSTEPNPLESI